MLSHDLSHESRTFIKKNIKIFEKNIYDSESHDFLATWLNTQFYFLFLDRNLRGSLSRVSVKNKLFNV